jgi:hypothetical protein
VPLELASPTFRFLVACVRRVFDPSATRPLEAIDRSSIDWDLLRRLARENRVDVLLLHGLRPGPQASIPPGLLASLDAYEHDNRRRNDASLRVLEAILSALAERAVVPLVFKGPVLGHLAYPDPGARFFWDLDLLVRETELPAVHDALRSLRYQRDELSGREEQLYARYHFAHTYSPAVDGPDIDVHWSLFPANFPVPVDYRGLRDRSIPVDVAGVHASTFSREDTLVYVALHGAKEEWRRLQMIADVAALVAATPALDWDRCLRIAATWHARRQLFLALHLAVDWFGARLPPAVMDAIAGDPAVSALAADVLRRLELLTGRGTSIFDYSRWRMLSFDRAWDRARYAWRTISAPRIEHLSLVKLQLPFAAYVPIRLLHDYVAIPVRDWSRRGSRKIRSGLR